MAREKKITQNPFEGKDEVLAKLGKLERIDITQLEYNEGQLKGISKNPRYLKQNEHDILKKSLTESSELLEYKPLMVYPLENGNYITVCGNMRLRIANELRLEGHSEFDTIPCFILKAETPIQKIKEYAIKDNVQAGNWDWDELANGDWEVEELQDWGVECAFLNDTEEPDNLTNEENQQKGNEVDVDSFGDKVEIKLKFSIDEHRFVNEKLREYDNSNEIALLKMLGYEER